MSKSKVTIVGVGFVGSTISYALMLCGIVDEIVLIDRNPEKVRSEINDIRHGFPFVDNTILRSGDYIDCKDSDIIILAVGRNRKVGESRLDLANDNVLIVKQYIDKIIPYYNNNITIVVTNPIDIITKKVTEWLKPSYGKVFGTGCILDSSRFIRLIADYLKVEIKNVRAMIIGEHGDSQVPLWSQVKVCNEPIDIYCSKNKIVWNDNLKINIQDKVKNMGISIISGKGRTQFGIATCTVDLINAIINNKEILVSVSSLVNNQYGISNVSISLPTIINNLGIKEVYNMAINENEQNLLKISSTKIANFIQ